MRPVNPPADTVVRAVTQDGAFRVIVTLTTATVKGAVTAQDVSGSTAARLGELVTGAVLVREAMAPDRRVQLILQGSNKGGTLVADSHPDGSNRGIVNLGGRREVVLAPGSLLQVLRTLPAGMHQGVVEVPPGGGVSDALMAYMQESEQVASVIAASSLIDEDPEGRSGGYFVQLLPEAERGLLMVMTERLASFPSLASMLKDPALTAQSLLAELLHGMPFTLTAETGVHFGCHCSRERLLASLGTLPQGDIAEMIQAGEPLHIRCDGCAKEYVLAVDDLAALIQPPDMFGGAPPRGSA
ncbi:MAG: Hsp33 family molecular chaperone HslO [Polyangiaceae bacterium]